MLEDFTLEELIEEISRRNDVLIAGVGRRHTKGKTITGIFLRDNTEDAGRTAFFTLFLRIVRGVATDLEVQPEELLAETYDKLEEIDKDIKLNDDQAQDYL